jgi:hypothetical protein
LPAVEGVVESEFVRPLLSGANLLPYRTVSPLLAVVPCDASHLFTEANEIELYPGLHKWWRKAEETWETHRSSERLSLLEQLDYQSKFAKQLPIPRLRIVYNASGMHLCAAKLEDRRALVAKSLYWAAVRTEDEADFLCTILNSGVATDFVRPFMSYGKDERHFDKHVWQLPIPTFDPRNQAHARLVKLGRDAEAVAKAFPVDDKLHFAASRRRIRESIQASAAGTQIEDVVYELLS